jgi:hypothetical protein
VAGLFAARFKATTVFGIDLADILTSEMEDQRLLQEKCASGQLWIDLMACLTANNNHFGQWVDEAPRIVHRMGLADRKGGKSVWQRRFLSLHSPLLMDNHNYGLLASGHKTRVGNELDPAGARYRSAFLQDVNYRLTREGVLVATYEVDFRAASYAIPDVINALNVFREDSFNTLQRFLADYFGDQQRRTLLGKATGLSLDPAQVFDKDAIAQATHFHSLVVVEGFRNRTEAGFETVPLERVVESRELAGILNEAHWYDAYSNEYRRHLSAKQFGYRADEIYIIERRTTVIVAARCWLDDPLVFYRQDLQLVIEHHIGALALLMQQLAFYREYSEVRLIEKHEPVPVLPLVLAARSNLTLLIESLDFTSLVRHGFTRLFAQQLRHEMEFERALDALTQRIADMGEAIDLKSSVQSAQAALALASRNNLLQLLAIILAIVAVILTVIIQK